LLISSLAGAYDYKDSQSHRDALSTTEFTGWDEVLAVHTLCPLLRKFITQENYVRNLGEYLGLSLVLSVGLTGAMLAQESAKQDMKDAGHETKQAAKDTGHATKTTAKKTGHKVKHTTKKATHKAARKTDEGARKVEEKTQ
jgi:hypothetical protein